MQHTLAKHGIKMPARRILAISLIVAVLLVVVLIDGCSHMGRAYAGVSVGDIDVSGMTKDQIIDAVNDEYGARLAAGPVIVYASEAAKEDAESGADELMRTQNAATSTQVSATEAQASQTEWSTTAEDLSAEIDASALADSALAVGRADGGIPERLKAQVRGTEVPLSVSFDDTSVDDFASKIDQVVGDARVDTSIAVADGIASVVAGHDGSLIDRSWFEQQISESLLSSSDRSFVAEVTDAPSRVSESAAQTVADEITRAIAAGAAFSYEGTSWTVDANKLGSWVKVDAVDEPDGSRSLVPSIDAPTVKSALLVATNDNGSTSGNVTVSFSVDDGEVTVHTAGAATAPRTADAVSSLQDQLFGKNGSAYAEGGPDPAHVDIARAEVPASMTLDEAEDFGVVTTLGTYTTSYSTTAGTEPRNHNIRLAAAAIDDTVCAAGQQWSFNDRAGECNEERGFEAAGSILDGEYVDSIGGGICQVATTVFNAVYEAGLQVDFRRNHSLYISSYPAGRDAAVSYPELDLKWSNQFASDVLLQTSTTDSTVTVTILGAPTGYTVSSDVGSWQAGSSYTTKFQTDDSLAPGAYYVKTTGTDGRSISVTRTVRASDGTVVLKDTFDSIYDPKSEVIVVGPNTDTGNLGHQSDR